MSVRNKANSFETLNATSNGLTDEEVTERLGKIGYNRLPRKERNIIRQFLRFMWNPLTWVMMVVTFSVLIVVIRSAQLLFWEVSLSIVLLLLANSAISFIGQRNASSALMKSAVPEAEVKRNGKWKVIKPAGLVPGDIIHIKFGDMIPADGQIISVYSAVSIDQATLTGESFPVNKSVGDEIFAGSVCGRGEAEASVIGTGFGTFFGRIIRLVGYTYNRAGRLQTILLRLRNICVVVILILIVVEILVMYAGFGYNYRRGINNLLVLLIGGIQMTVVIVMSIILAYGVKELSEHKAIVTRVSAIEELASVTILCSDKTGTLTSNKLVIDKTTVKKYSDVEIEDIIHYAAIASQTENPDTTDVCMTTTYAAVEQIREGIKELEFVPFNPTDQRNEITYRLISDGSIHRISKGMPDAILDLCKREKTNEQIEQFNSDVDEFAHRGLRALAVAMEDVSSKDEGNGFKLIGLIPISDSPRPDARETIVRTLDLGVKVKMITGDQLAIAKETGRRLGIGDNMFLSKVLIDGPPIGSGYQDFDDLLSHADGFAGVYPEHKFAFVRRLQNLGYVVAMIGDGVNDIPALAQANVSVAVANASDTARSTADIILTEPNLLVMTEAIVIARKVFQRLRNYSIYTSSITIRVIVTFSVLVFAFKFDFPAFLIVILGILNDATLVTVAKDRVTPSLYPNRWNLAEILTFAIIYGLYLAASTVVFFAVTVKTSFFQEKFSVEYFHYNHLTTNNPGWNDPKLHSIIYLQVSIISQALIFIIRSRRFFFMERPSIILVAAFALTQLIATLIAVYADWGFTDIRGCGWHWAGLIWIWDLVWFLSLDFLKFSLLAYFDSKQEQTSEGVPTIQLSTKAQIIHPASTLMNNSPLYRSTSSVPLHQS